MSHKTTVTLLCIWLGLFALDFGGIYADIKNGTLYHPWMSAVQISLTIFIVFLLISCAHSVKMVSYIENYKGGIESLANDMLDSKETKLKNDITLGTIGYVIMGVISTLMFIPLVIGGVVIIILDITQVWTGSFAIGIRTIAIGGIMMSFKIVTDDYLTQMVKVMQQVKTTKKSREEV